jgi:transposase-like protein
MKRHIPRTVHEFHARFGTEEACQDYLAAWRWPKGFVCPACESKGSWRLTRRRLYQCTNCRRQVSVTSGTAMHKSKIPLTKWFWAVFLVGRHKKGISALQLQADLGLGNYESAWLLLHKIRACFSENADFPLRGIVEVDETLIGAKQKGDPPGKDPGHKAIVVAAVEVTPRGGIGSLRLRHVPDYTTHSLAGFVVDVVEAGAQLRTDGWSAYDPLEREGYTRRETISSRQPKGKRHRLGLKAVHLVFSNLKTWLRGQFHGVSQRYLPAYLAEFNYRFNRRSAPLDLFGWVTRRLVSAPPRGLRDVRAAYVPG